MPVTVRIVSDTADEEVLVENGTCTFSISDRSKKETMKNDFPLYVSTKENIADHQELADWKMLLNAGSSGIKRFGVNCSLAKVIQQLSAIYGQNNVSLIEN